MNSKSKLRIVLFALTGFGNTVLQALHNDSRVIVPAVFTIRYSQPFPYYSERQLIDACASMGIICHHDVKVGSVEGLSLLQEYMPDLVIVATFKQILKDDVLSLPKFGVVNFHPSLLPKYRGPSPTNAVLLRDEKVTGITVHYMTSKIDEGKILLQRLVNIDINDNDGRLRRKLSQVAGGLIPELIDLFVGDDLPDGISQPHHLASYAPKPLDSDGYLEQSRDVNEIRNKVRAFNPLPGTSILVGNERVAINEFEMIQSGKADGVYVHDEYIDVVIKSQAIRLFKSDMH